MLAHRQRRLFTPEEYLVLEERSETKSEYHRGEIFSMTGGSMEHNELVRNVTVELAGTLRDSACRVFVADMRLHVPAHDLFTYPDVYVVCGPPRRMERRRDTLVDATLIVEVLSPSTEVYDRGEKFLFYQTLPSFREYLLVSQERILVERHTRRQPGEWLSVEFSGSTQTFELASIGVTIRIDEIYRGVEL
ncbi:MAG: Uma2 family endonuclease [Armatimonadetes bacterium]|nr:Uma2 family endonuclease [Armatimonadota bacterium]